MRLLLTSDGLSNQSIANALFELVGKKPEEISIAFISTAMNLTEGDKSWFIKDLHNLGKQNFKFIDIVDISTLEKEVWLPRLEKADVLFFSGGNTFYLMHWMKKSGLKDLLPEFLKTKVYASISAGSTSSGRSLIFSSERNKEIFEKHFGEASNEALNLVDFYIIAHLNSSKFPNRRKELLAEETKKVKEIVYAIDDQSALKVVDGEVEVVSEGEYLVFNKD
jgi:dipeptidase E